ncbi:MAG: hypothetical protein FWE36_05075 [Erysipelotrichales bacterium]|nr:hypothetical protein [Erysipelotrichales bacterium]
MEEHVYNKQEALYCVDNWVIITNLLNNGKTLINTAANELAVDVYLMETKDQINNVPKRLSNEIVSQIKEDAVRLLYSHISLTTTEDINFFYYGTFNDNIVVMIRNQRAGYFRVITEDILGILYPNGGQHIRIWNNGNFYRLSPAYEQGMLTMEDLKEIAYIHDRDLDDIFTNWRTWF